MVKLLTKSEVEAIKRQKETGKQWQEIADMFGFVSRNAARCAYDSARLRMGIPDATGTPKETIELKANGEQVSEKKICMSPDDIKNPDSIMKAHGYDPKDWELVCAKSSQWDVNLGKGQTDVFYSSRIQVKPRKDSISLDEIFESFKSLQGPLISRPLIYSEITSDPVLLEIPIMDVHFNKLSWGIETGENYDKSVATSRYMGVIRDFMSRSTNLSIERILFPIGQDFFNSDGHLGQTTAGTQQDNDSRWQKMFTDGCELLVRAIDYLSNFAPVDVLVVPGNHDMTLSYYAVNYIHAYFRNEPSVNVSINPQFRKYYEYGNNLIGYTHGDKEKKRIEGLMQIEAREQWGRTIYHEWHMGHYHSEQTVDKHGVIFRSLGSITGTDQWHYEQGYVGAIKKAQAFVWHKEYGLLDILYSVIKG